MHYHAWLLARRIRRILEWQFDSSNTTPVVCRETQKIDARPPRHSVRDASRIVQTTPTGLGSNHPRYGRGARSPSCQRTSCSRPAREKKQHQRQSPLASSPARGRHGDDQPVVPKLGVLVVFAVLFVPSSALAQESIAVGVGLTSPVGGSECPLDHCGTVVKNLFGEGALNITESITAAVSVGYGFESLNTSLSSVAINGRANSLTIGSGIRAYGPAGPKQVFAQMFAGYLKGTARVDVLGHRTTVPVSGLWISPGVGVDIASGEWVVLRLSSSLSIAVIHGQATGSFGIRAGIVFFGG